MMNWRLLVKTTIIGCFVFAAGLFADGFFEQSGFVRDAQARVGRPLTPASVAGVARRTTRRTIRRTTVYVAVLPVGCSTTVVINGATLYHCGGTYYQTQGNQFVIVNVD